MARDSSIAAIFERFTSDPLADHSARFPLSRVNPTAPLSGPSPAAIRPWSLGGMRTARQQGDPLRDAFTYDHDRQIALDGQGRAPDRFGPDRGQSQQ